MGNPVTIDLPYIFFAIGAMGAGWVKYRSERKNNGNCPERECHEQVQENKLKVLKVEGDTAGLKDKLYNEIFPQVQETASSTKQIKEDQKEIFKRLDDMPDKVVTLLKNTKGLL